MQNGKPSCKTKTANNNGTTMIIKTLKNVAEEEEEEEEEAETEFRNVVETCVETCHHHSVDRKTLAKKPHTEGATKR